MNKLLVTLFATALGFAIPAFAHDDAMGEHCHLHTSKTFEEADTDHDGTLDKEEAKALCKLSFDKMDADHDGTVTKEELNACGHHKHDKKSQAMHEKRSKEFSAADADNDGTLTKDEAKKLPHVYKNFDAIDADHDGTVDRDEVHNFMHKDMTK